MPGAWLGTDSKTTPANGALALLKQAKAAKRPRCLTARTMMSMRRKPMRTHGWQRL